MKPTITISVEQATSPLFIRAAIAMMISVGATTITGVALSGTIASAILLSIAPLFPLLALIYLVYKLPGKVNAYVEREIEKQIGEAAREAMPEHIEFAAIDDLRRELLTREPGVLFQFDHRYERIMAFDTCSDKLDRAGFQRLYSCSEVWAKSSVHIGQQRGVLR